MARGSAVVGVTTRGGATTGVDRVSPEPTSDRDLSADDVTSTRLPLESDGMTVAEGPDPTAARQTGEVSQTEEGDGDRLTPREPDSEAEYDTASGSDVEEGEINEFENLIRPSVGRRRAEPTDVGQREPE